MAENVCMGVKRLPSGYTRVEYIESSGTQYIDTGFKPNQNTRLVLSCYNNSTDSPWVFGSWNGANIAGFAFSLKNGIYYGTQVKSRADSSAGAYDIDFNKNAFTINGSSVTLSSDSFNGSYTVYLFALNAAGTVSGGKFTGKIYSCQIYDGGTLARDYVPCLNADGTAGLYDTVNGTFYGNKGTGSFTTGATLESSPVARTVNEIYVGDRNGVARKIKKAYFGDENGIAQEWFTNSVVGKLAVGSSVFMNVNGVRTEFIVVHQGIPNESMYDRSCYGTWLLMKDIYELMAYDDKHNYYEYCDIRAYLADTFINLFDTNIQNVIKLAKIPYIKKSGSVATEENGIESKLFLLAGEEVGDFMSSSAKQDGDVLSYFNNVEDSVRIAYFNGTATDWWLRTGSGTEGTLCCYVQNTGRNSSASLGTYSKGIRPAMILPRSARIDDNFNVIG